MKDTQRNGIDKLTAHLLAGHEYKLVDKEGTTTFTITGIMDDTLYLIDEENTPHYFRFDEAGTDFFVLCRPLDAETSVINSMPYGAIDVLLQRHFKPSSLPYEYCKFIND